MTNLIPLSEIEGEPRVRDLDLADALGFDRPRVIRELVRRNSTEIEALGPLAVRHGKSRGQDFAEHWLNEPQALLVCMFARTPKAAEVRKQIIEVFMAWRRRLAPQPVAPTPVQPAYHMRAEFFAGYATLSACGPTKQILDVLQHVERRRVMRRETVHVFTPLQLAIIKAARSFGQRGATMAEINAALDRKPSEVRSLRVLAGRIAQRGGLRLRNRRYVAADLAHEPVSDVFS